MGDLILNFIKLCWKKWCDHRDSKKIYKFLLASKLNTDFTFRTTHAIASKCNLTEDRVEALCASHKKIRRNEKEKQSWTLVD